MERTEIEAAILVLLCIKEEERISFLFFLLFGV
jgi:hypothetical protein